MPTGRGFLGSKVLLLTACLALAVGTAGCAARRASETRELAPSQVRQYRGEKLDSVDSLRENSIKGPQKVDIATYRLKVVGEVKRPLTLTYDEVVGGRRVSKVVELFCVEGWSAKILWEGVLLRDILEQAGYDKSATTVIFRCKDGYFTSLPLDYIVKRDIILADRMNAIALPEERGYPFQVVAEDKWGYKWAKWITEIEVSKDSSFRGYWEKRGYPNAADLPVQ